MSVRDRLDPADVERMFDRIAGPVRPHEPRHDGRASTSRWRALAARESGVGRGATVLDACCGTGDLALELARVVGRSGQVTGPRLLGRDAAPGRAQEAGRRTPPTVEWVRGDATAMPFADNSFAAATIAFGLRNLPDPEAGLRELARVVRPGGRVVCLEITRPATRAAASGFYSLWFDRGIPALGKVFDRGGAYSYLPASVRRFPGPDELGEAFHRAGMDDVRYRLLAGGIVAPACRRGRHGDRRGPRRAARSPAPRTLPFLAGVEQRLADAAGRRPGRPRVARDARRRRQAPAAAARADRGPARARASDPSSRSPPAPPSSCTWRRSCTTTCSTPRRCAAATRPSGRATARRSRARPATTSSRSPSPG